MENNKTQIDYLKSIFIRLFFLFSISIIIYKWTKIRLFEIIYILCIVIVLHIIIRVIVGESLCFICKSVKFDYNSIWFKEHCFEKSLYDFLHIKDLKQKMITAKPELYNVYNKSFEEIIHNMTVAEITHEISIFASFIPCLLIVIYGYANLLIVTSIVGSLIDLIYVFIQRYNRPRLISLLNKMKSSNIYKFYM